MRIEEVVVGDRLGLVIWGFFVIWILSFFFGSLIIRYSRGVYTVFI